MKKIHIIPAALIALLLQGCADMLDVKPYSTVAPQSITTADIDALRTGMYRKVQDEPTRLCYIMFDMMGGNLTTKASSNPLELINSLTSDMSSVVEEQWQGLYIALMQVNNVFSIAQGLPEGTLRDKVLGECHYFRAWLHLCLVTRFGDVILRTHSSDEYLFRTPAAEVWSFIDGELALAIQYLGAPNEGYYYLSADAAKALKARVALYMGHKQEAWQLAEELISKPQYALDDYDKIFRAKTNQEIIFAFSCLTSDGSTIAISTLFYSYNHPNSGSYVYAPAPDVMTMYDDNDTRKEISITTLDNLNFINKYPSGQVGTDPVVISRLGEMYLISAEAQGLQNGLARLNDLRQKRGLAKVYPASEGRFIDAILEERRKELLCENHRWYDLVRTGKAVTVLGIQSHQTLLPVPARERSVNKNLSQNDGY